MSYVNVNGLSMYYEEHGEGTPLIMLHGGLQSGASFAPMLPELSAGHRVILVDLQAHGRTADIDRPLRPELLAQDVAALIDHLGLGPGEADLLGYSFGAAVALRVAIRFPEKIRRLVLCSTGFRRDGWHAEALAGMDALSAAAAEMMRQAPIYHHYAAVAPRPQDWPVLVGRIADFVKLEYDLTEQVAALRMPTLLVFGDSDAVRPAHIVEFFGLLGGGLRDVAPDGSGLPACRLAVLPGASHYTLLDSPLLLGAIRPFLESEGGR